LTQPLTETEPRRVAPSVRIAGRGVAGLSVAGSLPLVSPLFDGGGHLALVLAAVVPVVAVLVAPTVAASARISLRLTELALVVLAGLVLVIALPGDALHGLPDGVARLLTTSLPTTAGGPMFGVAVAFVYVASALAVALAASGRVAWGCAVPAAALDVGALLVGAGGPAQPDYPAALFVLTCGLGVLIQQLGPSGWSSGSVVLRRFGVGLIAAAIIAALAVPLAGILPGDHSRAPFQLRAAVAPPPELDQRVGLLDTYSAMYDGPAQTVFTAQVSGADPTTLDWQLATYDQFNGVDWTSSAVYQRAGTGLPPGPHLRVATQTIRAVIAPSSLPGYLPTPGRAESVSISGLGVAASDGELLIPAGFRLPAQLTVTSTVADPTPAQLINAEVPSGAIDVTAASVPPRLKALANRLAASAPPYAFARLTALSDYLTAAPFVLHPPGHSPIGAGYFQVMQLLSSHDGSSEQYAAAFAVLARAMGFPTRLAVGYTGGTPVPGTNTVTVTTRDLRVWPEVDLTGLGWVTLPSTPGRTAATKPVAAKQPGPGPLPSPLAQALQSQNTINAATSHHPAGGATGPSGPSGPTPRPVLGAAWWIWVIVLLAVMLVAGVGAVLVAKAVRRQRQRTRGSAPDRVAGAWEHTVDRLAEYGLSVPASLTAPEVVVQAEAIFGTATAEAVQALAPAVDAARYDRGHPADDAAADRSWAAAARVGSSLRAGATRTERIRAGLSPAPLQQRRHGPRGSLPSAGTTPAGRRRRPAPL
jgi:transglutaminase-like putative cysteine protease